MALRGMFANINRALSSTTPQQRAQMLAIAGGASPSPTVGNALYGQSQSIMQALQDEARLKAQAEQEEANRRVRMSEAALDRDLRGKEGDADRKLTSQHYGAMERNDAARTALDARKSQVEMLATQAALKEQEAKWNFVKRVRSNPKATAQEKLMADMIEGGGSPAAAMYGQGGGGGYTDFLAQLTGGGMPGGNPLMEDPDLLPGAPTNATPAVAPDAGTPSRAGQGTVLAPPQQGPTVRGLVGAAPIAAGNVNLAGMNPVRDARPGAVAVDVYNPDIAPGELYRPYTRGGQAKAGFQWIPATRGAPGHWAYKQ